MTDILAGITVLDLSRVLAGPYAAMLLSDLGATVIKIEQPSVGDEARGFGPFINGVSGYFVSVNRGKKGVTLDLKHPRGREVFLRLAQKADVLVENFRTGAMERLGIGYGALSAANPRLIYLSLTGFGRTGPRSPDPAYDMIIQGMSGIMSVTGEPSGRPVRVGTSIGDLSAALFGVIGVALALFRRERTGKGGLVDIAMLDSLFSLLENAVMRAAVEGAPPAPLGTRHSTIAPFDVYPTKDGAMVLCAGNDVLWGKFLDVAGRPDLKGDVRFSSNRLRCENVEALTAVITVILSERTTAEWIEVLRAADVPAGPLNNVADAMRDPQIIARGMLSAIEQPGAGTFTVAGSPVRIDDEPPPAPKPAPALGEHTEKVLKDMLGMGEGEIGELRKEKAI
ncbi:MAG: CoA transferase [Deltaproteobacteria bacterium]|nr:CoA transferase [Candidatus Zymogenaceae bacterium]